MVNGLQLRNGADERARVINEPFNMVGGMCSYIDGDPDSPSAVVVVLQWIVTTTVRKEIETLGMLMPRTEIARVPLHALPEELRDEVRANEKESRKGELTYIVCYKTSRRIVQLLRPQAVNYPDGPSSISMEPLAVA